MSNIYNVYSDESCHLLHDGINDMVLGAVWCPQNKIKEINHEIQRIKQIHGVKPTSEIKWTKVAPVKEQLYFDIIEYFFANSDLHFRCLVIPDKGKLKHEIFHQTHDDFYYKMYYAMLKTIFSPCNEYNVYIDIKDTTSTEKASQLHKVCCNDIYDFSHAIIKNIQPIRSHEVQIMQIVDILIGAVCFANRKFPEGEHRSETKMRLVEEIRKKSSYKLTKSTLYREDKFNVFIWNTDL